jgi:hypothetical protein
VLPALPLEPVDELTVLRRGLDQALTRLDRSTAANRLFRYAHQLWQAGDLNATEYRLVLAQVDESREAPVVRLRRPRLR